MPLLFMWIKPQDLNNFNAIVLWRVVCHRLDGDGSLILSGRSCPHNRKNGSLVIDCRFSLVFRLASAVPFTALYAGMLFDKK